MKIECPTCKSNNLAVEKRPDGNAICMSCGWQGEYKYCFPVNRNDRMEKLEVALNCCKNDYWFMTNLLEKYSTDKDQAIKDCIERMKFRKGLFNILEVKNE